MHQDLGLPSPVQENWALSIVIRGINRDIGKPAKQMMAITPQVLSAMHSKLDFARDIVVAFWAACLVAFFTFFRKSTLLPESDAHKCKSELCRSDVSFNENINAIIHVKHSKTIQNGERVLSVPVPTVKNSILCPVTALKRLWASTPGVPPHAALFSYKQAPGRYAHLTQATFVRMLRSTLSACGFHAHRYSGHSFRRGGATFALACGVPVELIKLQGDWRSSAVERYLDISMDQRNHVAQKLSNALS